MPPTQSCPASDHRHSCPGPPTALLVLLGGLIAGCVSPQVAFVPAAASDHVRIAHAGTTLACAGALRATALDAAAGSLALSVTSTATSTYASVQRPAYPEGAILMGDLVALTASVSGLGIAVYAIWMLVESNRYEQAGGRVLAGTETRSCYVDAAPSNDEAPRPSTVTQTGAPTSDSTSKPSTTDVR